ncbi:lysylphosphatidylglycerol synthase transmembrane domain-containing protein [Dyadobacter sp. CY343]|uniref:lysylphosphatidylglycerol synthase transmembrane domain-containing protein n=1 Tax=Dyadobacter sp. CY343 TaxID=2907299 RepID=UPI001F27DE3F|nr:lysylphosphatidylglycerol synthase transmembrane domain-containing protein [Dyadobacter sp. CY343]MCE7060867.1 flippase-like domain-containing protein [Dyadobacter sp. CY343]
MKISPAHIRIFKIILVLSILILLFQFIRHTDLAEVKSALQNAGAGFIWVIVSTFVAYWFGAIGWWFCLGESKKHISHAKIFVVRHISESVGAFNPASVAGGDMFKVFLLKPYGIDQQPALTSVIIYRFLMILSQLVLLVAAMIWLVSGSGPGAGLLPPGLLVVMVAAILLLAGFCFFWVKKAGKLEAATETSSTQSRLQKVSGKIRELRIALYQFALKHPRELVFAFICFLLHWLIGSVEFYIILKLLGYDVTLMHGLLLDMGVVLVKSAGAFVPGQIGVEEIGNKLMLAVIGITSATLWISVSALRRTRQLFWILMGALFYALFARTKKAIS